MAAHAEPLLHHLQRLLGQANADTCDDAALLQRFVSQRDETAFAALLARHGPIVHGVCRRILHDDHEAEDAFQAVFLLFARKASSLRHPETLAAWLYGAARRLALTAQRSNRRRRQRERESAATSPARSAGPLDELSARELFLVLDEEMARLPERYRLPLILCGLEGRSQAEAARLLGWTAASVRGRIERGRARLRTRLIRRGLTLGASLLAMESMATAAVSAALRQATVQQALTFAAGSAEGIAASVLALVETGVTSMMMTKAKIGLILLLMTIGLAAGTSALVYPIRMEKPPEATKAEKAQSAKPEPAKRAHTDRYGDPLPPGAMMRLGTVRFRHGQRINWVAFSPDGKLIASASTDHTIRLWERATGREVRRMTGHKDAVTFVAFTADGKRLVSASGTLIERMDTSIRLWEAATGREVRRLLDSVTANDPFSAVALSADGKTVAAGRRDQLWLAEVPGGRVFGNCRVPDGQLKSIRFSPDGQHLATDFDSVGGICLFDVKTNRLQWQNKDQPSDYMYAGLAFAPDGRTLAAAINVKKPMRLLDVASGKEVRRFEGKHNAGAPLLFSRDGKRLFSDGWGRNGIIWDVAAAKAIGVLDPPISTFRCLVLSPDGKTIAEAGERAIRFWDAATGKALLGPEAASAMIDGVALSPDGKTLLTASHFDPVAGARVWDLDSGRQQGVLKGRESSRAVAFSPNGKRFAAGCSNATPVVADTATGRTLRTCEGAPQLIDSLAWSPDGKLLVGTGWIAGTIRLWDPDTGKELPPLGRLPQSSEPKCLAFSPDGKYLATGGMDRVIRLWDVAARNELRQLTGQQGTIWDLAFSPDGRTIAGVTATGKYIFYANGTDRDIRLWDTATGQLRRTLTGPEAGSWSVAWSPNGRILATGGEDGNIRLWETATGQERTRLTGHEGPVAALAFTRDGRRLISGSSDTTALVWDLTGRFRAGRFQPRRLSAEELNQCWNDLAGPDAARAYRSIVALTGSPKETIPFLKDRLPPLMVADPKRVAPLLAALDGDQFAERDKATTELEKMGLAVEPSLRKALSAKPSLEARQRIESILEKLTGGPRLRFLRALEILENIATAEARQVLEALSKGTAELWPTQEAKAALARLAARSAVRP